MSTSRRSIARCCDRARPLHHVGDARVPAGVRAGGHRATHHVAIADRGRREAQPTPTPSCRPHAPWRPAQPRDERHRQPRPEPAADAEPDAHLGADRRGCDGDDDPHLSAARVDRDRHHSRVAVHDLDDHPSFQAPLRRAVGSHRRPQCAGRGGVHRPRAGEGVRSATPRRSRPSMRRTTTCSRRASPPSSSRERSSRR